MEKYMKIKKFLINLLPSQKLRHQQQQKLRIHGKNNNILGLVPRKLKCEIYGNNNKIVLGKNLDGFLGNIFIGTPDSPCDDCYVEIGDNSTAYFSEIRLFENGSYIKIGEDCMFSSGIKLWCSDSHSILNMENEIVNLGKSIEIGNHVWIGADVKIGKNTKISDNSIV